MFKHNFLILSNNLWNSCGIKCSMTYMMQTHTPHLGVCNDASVVRGPILYKVLYSGDTPTCKAISWGDVQYIQVIEVPLLSTFATEQSCVFRNFHVVFKFRLIPVLPLCFSNRLEELVDNYSLKNTESTMDGKLGKPHQRWKWHPLDMCKRWI